MAKTEDIPGAIIGGAIGLVGASIVGLVRLGRKGYDAHKKAKELAPTKCPSCRKTNALAPYETEILKATPMVVQTQAQRGRGTTPIRMVELHVRNYMKCAFCGNITYTDSVEKELESTYNQQMSR